VNKHYGPWCLVVTIFYILYTYDVVLITSNRFCGCLFDITLWILLHPHWCHIRSYTAVINGVEKKEAASK